MSNINNNLGYVVEKAKNPATFVELCEGRYNKIIYFKDSNIAYIIVEKDNNYIMRKKKIFNNRQIAYEKLYHFCM
mgnify:CR=1 FL=1